MNLVTLPSSPVGIGKVLREARSLARGKGGSNDDIADDLFALAKHCYDLRLTIMKLIEIDNLLHREMAKQTAAGKAPSLTLSQWETPYKRALQLLQSDLEQKIKIWKKQSLNRCKQVFRLSLDQLIEADNLAKDNIDALEE